MQKAGVHPGRYARCGGRCRLRSRSLSPWGAVQNRTTEVGLRTEELNSEWPPTDGKQHNLETLVGAQAHGRSKSAARERASVHIVEASALLSSATLFRSV